jgi:hypothetical protein
VPDTARTLRLLLRLVDGTVAAPLLDVIGPAPLRVTALAWDSTSVLHGDTTRLSIAAEGWENRHVPLAALRVRGDGSQLPLAMDSLGLPATVALTADTTRIAWAAKWLPEQPDTARALRLLVRLADSSVAAPLLSVRRPLTVQRPAPAPMPPSPIDDPVVQWHSRSRFLVLARPVAGQMAMLVDLERPVPARLDIFDAQGRRVRSLADRVLPKGATVLLWDGRNADGAATRTGIYFARLTTPEGCRTVRLIRLR